MKPIRTHAVRAFFLLPLLAAPMAALAQTGTPPPAMVDSDRLETEIARRADAHRLCWTLGEPRTVDWIADNDPGYRRTVMSHYALSQTVDGWRWATRDGSRSRDLRAAEPVVVEGVPFTALEVHTPATQPWATLRVDGELSAGSVRFEWSPPPERLCMSDGLSLNARVEVTEGDPGAHQIVFILPLSPDQLGVEGSQVKACSPTSTTQVDSGIGFERDQGDCVRDLYHLDPTTSWGVWVGLPDSFYVVYPYVPAQRR